MTDTTTPRVNKVRAPEVAPNRRRGGDIRVVLSPRSVGATSGFMGTVTLAPAEYVAEHYHPYSEEFLLVMYGRLLVRLDGNQWIELEPGEGLMIPIGVRHRVSNPGDIEAYAVFHLSPLAPRPELGHVDTEPLPEPTAPHLDVGGTR